MKKLITFVSLLFVTCFGLTGNLYGQYFGGSGDGAENVLIIQLDLSGVPGGVQALYIGGRGDGFDQELFGGAVTGQLVDIYGGGSGDGHDHLSGSFSLNGQTLTALYTGGGGDGFDHLTYVATLDGTEITGLYSGGGGDGFDQNFASLTLDGETINGLFTGGSGDGFSTNKVAVLVGGEDISMLYGGGAGDGFDLNGGGFGLDGQSLAVLYGGGAGDGFDVTQLSGVVPLPLTLISFEAIPEATFVLLRWVTEDELDTDFFTIEKTREGLDFDFVSEVEAAGFSEPGEQLHYSTRDEDPWNGSSFYRLKTTDFDGAIALSHLIEVNYNSPDDAEHSFELFPNPNTGKHFSLLLHGYSPDHRVTYTIIGVTGQTITMGSFYPVAETARRFELPRKLSPGSYLIRLESEDGKGETKILLVGK
ncbi:hypothetical protein CEQ90_08785 [Lewinellaceae bacterium SD302]|nr:hypothetical protein CEQ90_08785 [Lewinellaceae bacterium SD302]